MNPQNGAQRPASPHAPEAPPSAMEARVRLHVLEAQLASFEEVDWNGFAAEDPDGAQELWAHFQGLAAAHDEAQAMLEDAEAAEGEAEAEASRLALAETGRVLAAEIDGWSPEMAAKLVEYAQAFGVTLEELREVADPRLWKILHRAHLGEAALGEREAARRAAPVHAVRPAVQVGGAGAPGAILRDDLGAAEWMRRRNSQALEGR